MLKPVLCCSCNAKKINRTSLHHSNESHTIKHLKVYSHKFTQDRSMFPLQIERKNFGTKAKNKVENYKHANFKISGCHGKGSFQDKSIQNTRFQLPRFLLWKRKAAPRPTPSFAAVNTPAIRLLEDHFVRQTKKTRWIAFFQESFGHHGHHIKPKKIVLVS